jgi:threonine/homoserine/homoserine lactone efflux protein
MNILLKGFRFGLLLQIAVGPICFFIFQTASVSGFYTAMTGVLGVSFIDGLYILAALLGIGTLLNKNSRAKTFIRLFGGLVLLVFGISTVAGVFGLSFLPGLNFKGTDNVNNIFLKTLLLTLSNPLTILFWAGVFSTKLSEGDKNRKTMYVFGLGALLSTLVFLSAVAFTGSLLNSYLNTAAVSFLNTLVGLFLILFGIRTFYKKD